MKTIEELLVWMRDNSVRLEFADGPNGERQLRMRANIGSQEYGSVVIVRPYDDELELLQRMAHGLHCRRVAMEQKSQEGNSDERR